MSVSELKKAVKGNEPTFDWAIGWLGARKPDCDHARKALFPNPLETTTGKGDERLVG